MTDFDRLRTLIGRPDTVVIGGRGYPVRGPSPADHLEIARRLGQDPSDPLRFDSERVLGVFVAVVYGVSDADAAAYVRGQLETLTRLFLGADGPDPDAVVEARP